MSLDSATRPKLERVIRNWLSQDKMFTAFEVSLEVKSQGVNERHRNMRGLIHELIANDAEEHDFSRTLMDVGAPSQAWVYHPIKANPYDYVPLDRSGHDGGAPAAPLPPATVQYRAPQPLRAGASSPATNADGVFGLDRFGRLRVPGAMLAAVGLAARETAHIFIDGAEQRLRVAPPRPSLGLSQDDERALEGDGSAFIEDATLDAAGIAGRQSYLIHRTGSEVVIEAAG